MPRCSILFTLLLGLCTAPLCAAPGSAPPASQPSADAWPLYQRAIARVLEGHPNINSPAESNLAYPDYPPYPPKWHELEKTACAFNAPAFALVHEARGCDVAHWPARRSADGKLDLSYLNGCRALVNEVADAALQQHLGGDDAAAVESLRDLLHMADLLDPHEPSWLIQSLVAVGVRAVTMQRLEVITAEVALTSDPADGKKLQVKTARELIGRLFDVRDPAPRYAVVLRRAAADGQFGAREHDRFITQLHRAQMEMNLAAMSLACHLFRFDHHRWPANLQDVTAYLPGPPQDAWGPMGYVVVRLEPPGANEAERPLVYSRCDATDGLFYVASEPQFSWYPGFFNGKERKQGGQFRDVSLWAPAHPDPAPTTQPLR